MATRPNLLEAAAGAALGIFVGGLVGLSTSPVVGSVLTALLALLGAFFGLSGAGKRGSGSSAPAPNTPGNVRLICFSAAAVLATLGGLVLRTGGHLSPSLQERQAAWQTLAFTEREAGQLVAFETLGLNFFADTSLGAVPRPDLHSSLFADRPDYCTSLARSRFASDEIWLRALAASGGAWQAVSENLSGLAPSARLQAVQAIWRLPCPTS